jgi:hypothetical protein
LIRADAILSFLPSEAFVAARLIVSRLPAGMNRKAGLVTMPEFSHLSVEAVREAKHFQELKTVYLERLLAFRRASTYETTSFHCSSFMLVRLSGSLERLESLLSSSSSMTASRYIFLRRGDTWLRRIATVVQEEIAQHGVETRLEW